MTTSAKDSANQGCRESYGCAGCGVREGIHETMKLSPVMAADPQIGWPGRFTGEHLCPLCMDKLFSSSIIMEIGRPGDPVKFDKAPLFPFSPGKQKRDWIVADLMAAQRVLTIKKEEEEKKKAYETAMRRGMVNAVPRYDEPLPTMPEVGRDVPDPTADKPFNRITIEKGSLEVGQEIYFGSKGEIREFLKAFEHAYGYNRDFAGLLNEMAMTHIRKNRDYAEDHNRYSNFEYANRVAEPFIGIDKVFATMIGIKMARMAELKKGKTPNFESLADSHLDECVYSTLWASYTRMKEREDEKRRGDKTAEG